MRYFLFCLLLVFSSYSFSQKLSDSRRSSAFTYIYKINEKESWILGKSSMEEVNEKFLHQLVDSFLSDNKVPVLEPGNYLLVKARQNRLSYELFTPYPIRFKQLNNNHDFAFILHNDDGSFIRNAKVYVGKKEIAYDSDSKCFRTKRFKTNELVRVYYNNALHLFEVNAQRVYSSGIWKKIKASFPIRNLLSLFYPGKNYRSFYYSTTHERNYSGFMVFNKPVYKPRDTVFLKAFVTKRKGRPLEKKLLLRISNRYLDIDSIIAVIKPYRKGNYTHYLVLSDSLNLELDEEYLITMEKPGKGKGSQDHYEEDVEIEDNAVKRKVVMRGKFKYEEYELGYLNITARTSFSKHSPGEKMMLFVKASDENELAVMDARAFIVIRPAENFVPVLTGEEAFIPDTIWRHEQQLDAIGETRIIIPDSIFPQASFDYRINCEVRTSNNETRQKELKAFYNNSSEVLSIKAERDSIHLQFKRYGVSLSVDAVLKGLNASGDTLFRQNILLPAIKPLEPFVHSYLLEYDGKTIQHEVADNLPVNCTYLRTRDSVKIKIDNPIGYPLWYTVFAGNKVIIKGAGLQWEYAAKSVTNKNYSLLLEYINGDQVIKRNFYIPYYKKNLQLVSDQPIMVYPGQKTTIQIQVNDADGRPVKEADLTAYAFTKKFQDVIEPRVPYLGRLYKPRKQEPSYQTNHWNENSIEKKLNWQRWSREMNLDTIEYYKFLHPVSIYINTEQPLDSITQLAPFVVVKGELQPVHQLYIDNVPFYFSQSRHLSRYSFPVTPGKHSIKLRTHNSMIIVNDLWMSKGVKNIISINADTGNKRISIIPLPDTLTAYEQELWNRYMILVEDNFNQKMAYIKQGEKLYYLNPGRSGTVLTGPLTYKYAEINLKNTLQHYFEVEGGYSYLFSENFTRLKEIKGYPFSRHLTSSSPDPDFSQFVLTEAGLNQLWLELLDKRSAELDLFINEHTGKPGNGKLLIEVGNSELFIKNIFVFKNNSPSFLRLYKGNSRNLGSFEPGQYRILFLLKGNKYFIKEDIRIKKHGNNYYSIRPLGIREADSMSLRMWKILEETEHKKSASDSYESDQLRKAFNDKYLDISSFKQRVNGKITNPEGKAIPFASVVLMGTNYGTTSDAAGNFTLAVPSEGWLVFSSVGHENKAINLSSGSDYRVSLALMKSSIEEVVVTAYGQTKRKSLGYSRAIVSEMLHGRVAGLMINNSPGAGTIIRLRGSNTYVDNRILVVINGLPSTLDKLNLLDSTMIHQIEILTGAEAVAIFGESAYLGVLNVTTKLDQNQDEKERLDEGPHSIRRNFRDHAYWKPGLVTDAGGKAVFEVEFPDDITNWRTYAIATTNKKQTGFIEGAIKSFKTLSANLALPQFAIEGDTINVIAKTMNYLTDSINVSREFYMNDSLVQKAVIGLKYAHIDTFNIVAENKDSLKMLFSIKKENGYYDGEERKLPVFPQGVLESNGFFAALHKDTSFQIKSDTGLVKIYADASLIPVWEDEVTKIRNYEYLCNEQLASKLKAILVQKRIDHLLKKPFKWEKYTRDLIRELEKNKATSGLWGWWNNTQPSMWISLHVMEALLQAQGMGYKVSVDKKMLADYLIYDLESFKGRNQIWSLVLLELLDSKADFKKYADSIDKYNKEWSLLDKLKLAEIKQKRGITYSIDSLVDRYKQTMFGNIYWGEENNNFFDNSIQITLSMYRLLKGEGRHELLMEKVRNYFLEKRGSGSWRNTYESSLILETILPEIMLGDSLPANPRLLIDSLPVTKFPFTTSIPKNSFINVSKQGKLPVYFTAYSQQWNPNPKKVINDFEVRSSFVRNGNELNILKAGEVVDLMVKVIVKKDAEYVMVEIPVPAGCSYKEKLQSGKNNEVHREYFKQKVSIFCTYLKPGNYEFKIPLLPRYTGMYHLNPARAEMMYFPVFYGRENAKIVAIR